MHFWKWIQKTVLQVSRKQTRRLHTGSSKKKNKAFIVTSDCFHRSLKDKRLLVKNPFNGN